MNTIHDSSNLIVGGILQIVASLIYCNTAAALTHALPTTPPILGFELHHESMFLGQHPQSYTFALYCNLGAFIFQPLTTSQVLMAPLLLNTTANILLHKTSS